MNLTEFKKRVLNKLFITDEDAEQYLYLDKIVPSLNECLVLIANGTLANNVVADVDVKLNEDRRIPVVDLPEGTLSVRFVDTDVPGATYYLPTSKTIKFNKVGSYSIICDALYPKIDENDPEDVLDTIPESITTCAVLYVASMLAADISSTTSLLIKNEYELALSRLDTDRQSLQESFKIVSEW